MWKPIPNSEVENLKRDNLLASGRIVHLGGNTTAFDVLRWFLPGLAWGWDMKGTATSDAQALGPVKLREKSRLASATLKKL